MASGADPVLGYRCAIATSIVDAVDETGYHRDPDDILESMGDDDVGMDEIEAVLKRAFSALIPLAWQPKICVTAY